MSRVTDVFIVDDSESQHKKYKIYCMFHKGIPYYIGCTKHEMQQRLSGHLIDTFNQTITNNRRDLLNSLLVEEKLIVKIIYSFNSEFLATICERVLINFVKNFINKNIFNSHCKFSEDFCNKSVKNFYSNKIRKGNDVL